MDFELTSIEKDALLLYAEKAAQLIYSKAYNPSWEFENSLKMTLMLHVVKQ